MGIQYLDVLCAFGCEISMIEPPSYAERPEGLCPCAWFGN